jgi:hypothetical protein
MTALQSDEKENNEIDEKLCHWQQISTHSPHKNKSSLGEI